MVGIHGLSPDLLQSELAETMVEACSPGPAPQPLTPASSRSDDEAKLMPVGLVPVEIDVTDEESFVDRF